MGSRDEVESPFSIAIEMMNFSIAYLGEWGGVSIL